MPDPHQIMYCTNCHKPVFGNVTECPDCKSTLIVKQYHDSKVPLSASAALLIVIGSMIITAGVLFFINYFSPEATIQTYIAVAVLMQSISTFLLYLVITDILSNTKKIIQKISDHANTD